MAMLGPRWSKRPRNPIRAREDTLRTRCRYIHSDCPRLAAQHATNVTASLFPLGDQGTPRDHPRRTEVQGCRLGEHREARHRLCVEVPWVAYLLATDNVLRPFPCPLIGGNQPVMRTRHRFSRLVQPAWPASEHTSAAPRHDHQPAPFLTLSGAVATAAPETTRPPGPC